MKSVRDKTGRRDMSKIVRRVLRTLGGGGSGRLTELRARGRKSRAAKRSDGEQGDITKVHRNEC